LLSEDTNFTTYLNAILGYQVNDTAKSENVFLLGNKSIVGASIIGLLLLAGIKYIWFK
jgi:hypothetical protein